MAAISLTDRTAALRTREGAGLDDERPQHKTTEANNSILYIHHSSSDRTLRPGHLYTSTTTKNLVRPPPQSNEGCVVRVRLRALLDAFWALWDVGCASGAGTSTCNVTSRRSAKPHLSDPRVRDRGQLAATCDPEPAPRLQICRPWVSPFDDRGSAAACCACGRAVAQALGNDVR